MSEQQPRSNESKVQDGQFARRTDPPVPIQLTMIPPHPCPYLPGLEATTRAFRTNRVPAEMYHDFMDAGFRRSGQVIYQPVCQSCRRCVPIRVPVDRFAANKSQRRCQKRNADLTVTVDPPSPTDEKFSLYQKYQRQRHAKDVDPDEDSRELFESFLYRSPVDSLEFCYRTPEGQLAAVGIADVCSRSFSSVYFYFDPDLSDRGLGTFGVLHELQWAREHNIPQYYLGFWVAGCEKMSYKINYRPYQLLSNDGNWCDGRRV
jgi:arginyl-tRNA--protein-N-Asp/Glu arginylyltransferase